MTLATLIRDLSDNVTDEEIEALAKAVKADAEDPETTYQLTLARLSPYQHLAEVTVRVDRQYEADVKLAGSHAISVFVEDTSKKIALAILAARIVGNALAELVDGKDPAEVERKAKRILDSLDRDRD